MSVFLKSRWAKKLVLWAKDAGSKSQVIEKALALYGEQLKADKTKPDKD